MQKATENPKRRAALGQGLDALIPLDELISPKGSERSITQLPIDSLLANPHQPRRLFAQESLADLSHSIKERGVIQPLIVRPMTGGGHEIVAGERRWRAAKMAASFMTLMRSAPDRPVVRSAMRWRSTSAAMGLPSA